MIGAPAGALSTAPEGWREPSVGGFKGVSQSVGADHPVGCRADAAARRNMRSGMRPRAHGRSSVLRQTGSERGQIIAMVVVSMVALLGMAALVLDVGYAWYAKRAAQAQVDAA